ncbi:hypothetical protein BXY58_2398 [Epilithonimonas arachidiradicis]|uniref:Uncharacterized protein n=1 Tax=Epilithonimonas arachidiradicis TaxID=1617282 RepID=A0A420D8E6_9FLAO|nr:hypothetical protein BXY58_2398 [Epilithonimonas arachidiradicis]
MYFQKPGTCCPLILLALALHCVPHHRCGVTVTIRAITQLSDYYLAKSSNPNFSKKVEDKI